MKHFKFFYAILIQKFGFDAFNEQVWVKGSKKLGQIFFKNFDQQLIDGMGVNGVATIVDKTAGVIRQFQTGYLFHYLTIMVVGLMIIVCWFLLA